VVLQRVSESANMPGMPGRVGKTRVRQNKRSKKKKLLAVSNQKHLYMPKEW
jgi:hypothetical protein